MADSAFLNQAIKLIRAELTKDHTPNVLEAGCGSGSLVLLDFDKRLVGIDIDHEQLENNHNLDEKIHGDLQSYELPRETFDLVICCDVLEHLPRPQDALANMILSIRRGGYLLIASPEPFSYKGFLAKYSPHWMRKMIFALLTGESYRKMLQGSVKKTFFPTYLNHLCARKNIKVWASNNGLAIIVDTAYDAHTHGLHWFYKPVIFMLVTFSKFVRFFSKTQVNLLEADYCLLLKKIHK